MKNGRIVAGSGRRVDNADKVDVWLTRPVTD